MLGLANLSWYRILTLRVCIYSDSASVRGVLRAFSRFGFDRLKPSIVASILARCLWDARRLAGVPAVGTLGYGKAPASRRATMPPQLSG